MVENSLDLLEFKHDFTRFVYNFRRVRWLKFWRRKLATRPTDVKPWARKPETDRWERRFGLNSGGDWAGWLVWRVMAASGHP